MTPPLEADPYENDPGHWGASLVNAAEILFPCLDAAGANSVAEVGAYAGDLTGQLVKWADRAGAPPSPPGPEGRRGAAPGGGGP